MADVMPRRFYWPVPERKVHPNGSGSRWRTGCYFRLTDLLVTDMGERGTGPPGYEGLRWIDEPPDSAGPPGPPPRRDPPGMDEMLGRPDP